MAFKAIFLCASALLVQTISGQCIGSSNGIGYGLNGNGINLGSYLGNGYSGCGLNNGLSLQSSGGILGVSSASPISPSGISVASENAIEGPVAVSGTLPFLAAVGFEGQVPSGGSAGVSYSCGNGNIGITGQNGGVGYGAGIGNVGIGNVGLSNVGLCNAGLGLGLAGGYGARGCGCGF